MPRTPGSTLEPSSCTRTRSKGGGGGGGGRRGPANFDGTSWIQFSPGGAARLHGVRGSSMRDNAMAEEVPLSPPVVILWLTAGRPTTAEKKGNAR